MPDGDDQAVDTSRTGCDVGGNGERTEGAGRGGLFQVYGSEFGMNAFLIHGIAVYVLFKKKGGGEPFPPTPVSCRLCRRHDLSIV